MTTPANVTLSVPLINGILNYLSTRPYAEVFQLIQELQAQALPQVQTPKAAPAEPTE